MADIWSRAKRSEVMARIKGTGNRSTELAIAGLMRKNGITGWRRHQPLPGRPDFSFARAKVAVFVDGCFWHGCPRCGKVPASDRKYWAAKIAANRRRDQRADRQLRAAGWAVLRVWECSLRRLPQAQLARIARKLAERRNQ